MIYKLLDSRSRDELDDTTGLVDLPLCAAGNKARLDDQGLVRRQAAFAENFSVAVAQGVDDGYELG